MLDFVMKLIPTLVVFGILVFIHELGHFIFAKLSGVDVEKFSLGFGPELIKFKKGGTVYAISIIPLGGFVKMAGETIEDRDEKNLNENDFISQNVWKRFSIIFAGPFMNYLLAFVMLVLVCLIGRPMPASVVGEVLEASPAYTAGIAAGDKVIAINGEKVSTWEEMHAAIIASEDDVVFNIERDGAVSAVKVVPEEVEDKDVFGEIVKVRRVGVAPSDERVYIKYPLGESFKQAGLITYNLTVLTYNALARLVTGRLSAKAVSGPLGIMIIAGKTAEKGVVALMQLTAFLSISLAIFNLLPFPALDGGHLFFIAIEAVFRKPVSFKVQERFSQVGFVLLMSLMVFVVWNDAVNFNVVAKVKDLIPFIK